MYRGNGHVAVKRIAVGPREAFEERHALFEALETVTGVRFVAAPGDDAADGEIRFDGPPSEDDIRRRTLAFAPIDGGGEAHKREIHFADTSGVDPRLRGRRMHEERATAGRLEPEPDDRILARCGREALWLRRSGPGGDLDVAASAPPELDDGRILRDLLRDRSFLSLVPLVHFVREVTADARWRPPPLRALVMVDDPNLHWSTYGHVSFREIAQDASRHGYHVSFATVPLDAYYAKRSAVRAFAERPDSLSLLIHGNNHDFEELMRPLDRRSIEAVVAQSLRRTAAFERRTGLHVDRVMCPPHGVCSEDFMAAMHRLGFDAICANSPFPWPPGRPPAGWPTAGWEGCQFLAGGFPVIPRHALERSRDDVVFRAFLDQPLIMYGHEWNLARGVEALREVVEFVNALGDITWTSSERIARTNFLTRRRGSTLDVRLLSRDVRLDIPQDVHEVVVHLPPVHGDTANVRLSVGGQEAAVDAGDGPRQSEPVAVRPGRLSIDLRASRPLDPGAVSRPPVQPRAVVRRAASEARDRLRPLGRLVAGNRTTRF